jgi:hypothetical protein
MPGESRALPFCAAKMASRRANFAARTAFSSIVAGEAVRYERPEIIVATPAAAAG